MWVYWVIFFLIVSFGAIYKYRLTKSSVWLFFFLGFVFFFIAAFRAEGVDNDYANYLLCITVGSGMRDQSFNFIAYVCYNILGSARLVFVIYALLSVSLLFFGLKKLAPYFFLSIMVYYSTSYVVHDLNAIRAGVAVGFVFFAIHYWINDRMWKTFLFLALATFFHSTFSLFFVLYFILKDNKRYLIGYILLVPIGYFAYFARIDALSLLLKIPILEVQTMAVAYNDWNKDLVSTVNVFSVLVLIKMLIFSVLVLYRKLLSEEYQGFYLYFKMYSLGLFFLIFFAALPGAAFRISDMLWVSECLLLPMLIKIINPRWVVTLLIILLCVFFVWLNYIQSNFVRPYEFNFEL